MKVRIHRGAKQIGGNCIEVAAQEKRIVLDVGRPLEAAADEIVPLPDVAGLAAADDPDLLGLFISHGHQDHWGLVEQVSPNVPIYIGKGAADILRAAARIYSKAGVDITPAGHLLHRELLEVGPFTITPFLNDHNAFDTYSLLIEADGRRLFYSADLQGHGPKRAIFEEMLRKPPPQVDVMLMEGTNVTADPAPAPGISEEDLRADLARTVRETKGMVLATYSSQSIDRMCSMYSAARRTGRTLVVDLLTARMAIATGRETVPKPGWEQFLVYVPYFLRRQIREDESFDLLPDKAHRIFPEALPERRGELLMTFRMSMARDLERADCLEGACAVWSQWPGYLERANSKPYKDFLAKHAIPLKVHHASGHAYVDDLKKLAEAVAPERLVPIHSFAANRFADHFANVVLHDDGEWWEV